MGKIFLNSLSASAIIGTLPHERLHRQHLTLDVEISTDMRAAGHSDDLLDALDYSAVEQEIVSIVENSSFQLLEALISAVGTAIIARKEVTSCRIRITKPAASAYGKSIAVEAEFVPGKGMLP